MDQALANIFLLNNAYFILSSVSHSELAKLVDSKFMRQLQDTLLTERSTYKEWYCACANLIRGL